MSDDIVENLKQPTQWFRIAFMVALSVALYLAGMILTLLIVAQALFGLLTGSDNRNLRELGAALTQYVRQVLDFLTYNSEFKPFPFAAFPGAETGLEPEAPQFEEEMDHGVEVHVPEGDDPATTPARKPRKRATSSKTGRTDVAPDGE